MATTTTNGDVKQAELKVEVKVEARPYAEDDKLGPIGAKVSAIYDPVDLRKAMLREFADAVQDARTAAGSADDSAIKAVHETRKALRRARAVLHLVAGALPKSERRAVERALQEARRGLSSSRDHAVAPDTLGLLALGDQDRDTANRVLANAAEAVPPLAEIKQLLAEAAARVAAQHEALAAALPGELAWKTVLAGLESVYGEARRARRASKRSRKWFHSWRRRSKELVYQLDLVSVHAGPRVAAIHDELAGITDTLGPAVDLIMVREFVTTYAQGIPAEDIEHLQTAVDAQIVDLMKETRRAARDSYQLKARKFAKRLTKAVRRDLTPADEADTNGELEIA